MHGTMGERLAWARNQQGLILSQVSERSGLAIGYISQLEKGSKKNPTIQALEKLARALGVSVAFIMGEVQPPPYNDTSAMLVSGQAFSISQRFTRWYNALAAAERQRIANETVEKRFSRVVNWLCEEFPDRFTRVVVAYQLGLSVRGLNDILERNCQVGPMVLTQMAYVTGIPITFFAEGGLELAREQNMPAAKELLRYTEAIRLAIVEGLTPKQLEDVIRRRSF